MLANLIAASIITQGNGAASVVSDLAILGAKSARPIIFKTDKSQLHYAYGFLGEKLSLDGKILFTSESVSALVDLQSGRLMWEERIQSGDRKDSKEWIVGTMSQWGHIPFYRHLDDAGLLEMESLNRWFSLGNCLSTNGKIVNAIVDIDPKSRKNPPNQLIPLGIKVVPMRTDPGQFSIRSLPNGNIEFFKYVSDSKKQFHYEVWNIAKGTNRISKRNTHLKAPVVFGTRPVSIDLIHGRILNYCDWKEEYSEYDCQTGSTTVLPYQERPSIFKSKSFYWHGQLVQCSSEPGLKMYSQDRIKVTTIGKYYWIANNSNQTFLLVQRRSDNSYWLVNSQIKS
jgi:hypothetical protein